ncbi:uncharacterized protein SAPINGB_P005910 [Magnusiomyces paraingens]|uniref:FACT complex subunit POB3 n=1 Tax=Magnusiomyces paraingens TaxID=2606893 RepID=A0A5E8C2E8_9ASCO|nr:uncharacterized protein SAPINGB_P005910 [Saprochaete ingens]VVT57867.1 unnamed protein product [Saprochaete ingens]
MSSQYENVYFNQSRVPGLVRLNNQGLGWKANEVKSRGGSIKVPETFLLPAEEIHAAYWSRAARGYEIRVQTKNKGAIQLDGFDVDDFSGLKSDLSKLYNVPLENRDHSLKGWNWGKGDFGRNEMSFEVGGKPAFEIAYADVANSNFVGKNDEVAVEFNLQTGNERVKAGDELVEIRFYVPGRVSTKNEDGEDNEDEIKEIEGEQSAASAFYEALKEKADLGDVVGEAIVSLTEILFLTPRGRYDIDMYPTSFRLRGKTYDYKIQYQNIQRLFLLPKPDEIHNMLILQLDPPLRQGQTRYPFLVTQFDRNDTLTVEPNIEDAEYEAKYKDKIKKRYDEATDEAVAHLFHGLTGRKMIVPGPSFSSQQPGISCSLKASEGYLYPLENCFLFVPKPTVYIPLTEVSSVTFSRISKTSSSRTFDMTVHLGPGGGEHQFSNISREEQDELSAYIKAKRIHIEMDMGDQPIMTSMVVDSDSDGDLDMIGRGSADEDEESVDEDFRAESESDVAEEFDSNHESSDSDDEDGGASDSEDEKPAKKKTKSK